MEVELFTSEQWQRLRDIRLRSLMESPDAFGGKFDIESGLNENDWRDKFTTLDFLVASVSKVDIGLMSVEVLIGDYGATCWVGGCWSDPEYRGQGILRAIFDYVDIHAIEKGWQRQGLGVWTDNYSAIAAYTAIGFNHAGQKRPSDRQPGRFYIHMVRDSPVLSC